MNKREFNALMRRLSKKKRLDPALCAGVDTQTKKESIEVIVRNRQPIVMCLMPEYTVGDNFDRWLNACGYMHYTTSSANGLKFRHTSEQTIV